MVQTAACSDNVTAFQLSTRLVSRDLRSQSESKSALKVMRSHFWYHHHFGLECWCYRCTTRCRGETALDLREKLSLAMIF